MDEKRAPGGAIIRRHGKVQVTGRKISLSCYIPEGIYTVLKFLAEERKTDISAIVRGAIRKLTPDMVKRTTPQKMRQVLIRIDPEDYNYLEDLIEHAPPVEGRRGEHLRKKTELIRVAIDAEIQQMDYKIPEIDFSFLQ